MQDEPARIRLQSLESRARGIDVWLDDLTGSLKELSDKLSSIEASGLSARLTDLEAEGDYSQIRLDDLQGKIANLDAMAQRIAALEAGTRPKCAEIMQQAIAPVASGPTVGYRDDNGQWRTSADDTRAAFVKLYNDLNCAEIAAPIPQR